MANQENSEIVLIKAISQVAKELNVIYQDEIMIKAVERLPSIFQVSYTAVFLYDFDDNTFVLQHHNNEQDNREKLFAMGSNNILSYAMEQKKPLLFESIKQFKKDITQDLGQFALYDFLENHCILLPLLVGQGHDVELLGMLVLANRSNDKPFSELEQNLIVLIAEILTHSIARTQRRDIMIEKTETSDSFRWNPFYEYYAREVYRTRRYQGNLSLLLLAVDDESTIKENYDEETLDYVLNESAKRINGVMRSMDVVSRKDRCFFVLLPETQEADAMIVAERLRKFFKENPFQYQNKKIMVKVSLGVACCLPEDTPTSFMEKASLSLEHARDKGDTIVVYRIMAEVLKQDEE